ncbi:MAG TPA: VOC family protein [Stellaceae bacterium]|jgi:catechol 2,3-dioxygenase-like lactoylglutathione lyase family enzyme
MRAFVRYLAVNTRQPAAMADYYKSYFGLHEVVRSSEGDIALTDGWFKFCLLAHWPDDEIAGMSHYGIAVDSLDALQARLTQAGSHAEIGRGRGGDFYGDYFVLDPHDMPWAISTRDFGLGDDMPTPFGVPRIRHAEISVGETHREMQWMIDVFGLREINCSKKIRDAGSTFAIRMLGDGVINVTFLPFDHVHPKVMSTRQTARKWAVQHFGWVVPDMMGLIASLPEDLRDPTPSSGNMAEFQALDPDENRFDLSQAKGFEVDVDLWERGDGPGGPPANIRIPGVQ